MLVLDDFDELRSAEERRVVAERLSGLATRGIAVVLATTDVADGELFVGPPPARITL
jgi:hypothetical protein